MAAKVYGSEEAAVRRIEALRKHVGVWPAYFKVRGGWSLSYDPPASLIELNRHGYLSLGTDTMHDG